MTPAIRDRRGCGHTKAAPSPVCRRYAHLVITGCSERVRRQEVQLQLFAGPLECDDRRADRLAAVGKCVVDVEYQVLDGDVPSA
jgi:hypothetical protein